jgi:ABC-2 type transport system permease protein
MNKYLTLTRVLLKNGSGKMSFGSDKKRMTKTALMWFILIVAFLPTIFMFTMMVSKLYDGLVLIDQTGIILAMAVGGVSAMVFFFGIFYAISTFYFSSDIQNLLPLPLRPSQILGAKFTVSLVYEYLTELLFFLPVFIMYGIKSSPGVLYYIYGLIIFLTLPVLPLSLATLIDMVVMRFTNVGRNKDKFRVVGGMIALLIGLSFSVISPKLSQTSMNQQRLIEMATSGNNSLVKVTSTIFPGSVFAANTLINSNNINGFINLILFLVCIAVVVVIFLYLSEKLYFKGVVGISEAHSKRKRLEEGELEKGTIRSSALKAFTIKELKLLVRTPIYFLNCVIMNFLLPLFLILPMAMQSKSSAELSSLVAMLGGKPSYILMAIFATSLFISPTNMITSTSISREGQNIYVNKYIPVSYRIQIMAKALSGFVLSIAGIVIIIILSALFMRLPIYAVLLSIVLGALAAAFSSFMGLLIDVNFPKLNWDNEARAVKQNFNGVLNMLVCVIFAGLTIFAVIMLKPGVWIVFFVLGGVCLAIDIILYNVLCTEGVEAFSKINI